MIIDFHVHTFPPEIAPRVLKILGLEKARILPFNEATIESTVDTMKKAGISYSVNLPVPTNIKQVIKLNRLAIEQQEELMAEGIIPFGGMNPDYEDYKTIFRDLATHGIRGVKLHPPYTSTNFNDIRYMRIIDAASEAGLIILTHAGIDISIHSKNYCTVPQILDVIEQVHPEKLILAHMGNLGYWDDVEKYLCGAPVWFDTAFSLGRCTPHPDAPEPPTMDERLPDEQFVRMCRKHGMERILFGTDSPWGDPVEDIREIRALPLTAEEREMIFSINAKKLLKL